MFDEYKEHDVAVYGGYLDDNVKIMQSASGGIATALAEHMLALGGFVAGVAYSEDLYRAEYVLIHDKSEIDRLKGSKYIECEKGTIYSDVKRLLDSGEKVLFFGLPCAVAALYKSIGARPENLLTCELICHGPTSVDIHREYLSYLENKYKSKVVDFSVRHKKDAWKPIYLYAKFEDGQVFEKPFYKTEYGYAFSVFTKESCCRCGFKGNNRQGDLMVGDFWGATEEDDYWNPYGVSVIFAETDQGHDFLRSTPGIKLFPASFEKAVEKNPMVITSQTRKGERDQFEKLLRKKGLIYAAERCADRKKENGGKKKISKKKVLVKMIPESIRPTVKKIYHTIFDP